MNGSGGEVGADVGWDSSDELSETLHIRQAHRVNTSIELRTARETAQFLSGIGIFNVGGHGGRRRPVDEEPWTRLEDLVKYHAFAHSSLTHTIRIPVFSTLTTSCSSSRTLCYPPPRLS